MIYLFVYGTLKKSEKLKDSILLNTVKTKEKYFKGTTDGCMSFPFIKRDDTGYHIDGKLYLVKDEIIQELDKYEDSPDFYKLEDIEIQDIGEIKYSQMNVQTYMLQG